MPPPSPPTLPPEIILQIIDSLIPANLRAIALPASDPITKTLVSLTRTSKVTSERALQYLYSYCLYIDSWERLTGVMRALPVSQQQNYHLHPDRIRPDIRDRTPLLKFTTSLYLAPFNNDWIDSPSQLQLICALLGFVAPTLKRLLLSAPCQGTTNMTFDQYNDEKYGPMNYILRKLTSLEVFCSANDDLWMFRDDGRLNRKEDIPWTHWPKLRVLALFGTSPEEKVWEWWGEMQSLERLILTGCMSADEDDFVKQYRQGLVGKASEKKLEVVLVNYENRDLRVMGKEAWRKEDLLQIRVLEVPGTGNARRKHRKCQEWVNERLLEGEETV